MPHQLKAVAFDVDAPTLVSLKEALPEWALEAVAWAPSPSPKSEEPAVEADLLVVCAGKGAVSALDVCRFLRGQARHRHTPLLVLVPPAQQALVREALAAGADSCLVLPIHAKEVTSILRAMHRDNQPGRHTLGLTRPQEEDPWRDDGGQG